MVSDRFRWVFCQLDTLRRCMPSSIRKALDELPTTLDDTYERALQGVPKEKRHHAHRLFQCLVVAVRPLRAEELAEIFAINFEHDAMCNVMEGWRPENPEEAVLSTCSTLITVIEDEGSRRIQFSHFSVKEFLTSDRLRVSEVGSIRDYHIPLDSAHTLLARACLAVLLGLDNKVVENRVETFPLALYAAQNWVKHAKYEDVASRVQGFMEDLFNPKKPHLAAWISLHDVAQDWYRELSSHRSTDSSLPETVALFYSALCGFSGVVAYLIITHAKDINAQYRNSGAPLHVASRFGHAEVVCLLLQHNANVNVRCAGFFNWMPLHFASWKGHTKLVQLFLDHNAEINAQSTINNTPLCVASSCGHLEVVRLLLRHGADLHIRSSEGQTPFQIATTGQYVEVAQLLLEHGAVEE
jgi:Ankyrin repeats (3 copies)